MSVAEQTDKFATNRKLVPPMNPLLKGLPRRCDYCDPKVKGHVPAAVVYDFGEGEKLFMCPADYDRIRESYEPTFAELKK